MVRNGWAIAYRRYSKDYVDDENYAKENKLGIWNGQFIEPYKWRKKLINYFEFNEIIKMNNQKIIKNKISLKNIKYWRWLGFYFGCSWSLYFR